MDKRDEQDQRSKDVRALHGAGHCTGAIAEAFGISRRRVQQIVADGRATSAQEVEAARRAYKEIAAARGERVRSTKAERDAFIDVIFADAPLFTRRATAGELTPDPTSE